MTKQTSKTPVETPSADLIEKVLLQGDLSSLDKQQRLNYYKSVCESLGLNPLTKPLDYIELDGKLVLYARKDCTEQLRKRYNISLKIISREMIDNVYSVIAQATLPSNRMDESMGVVALEYWKDGRAHQLGAMQKANALMRAETKAKRRVTLSICGLGMLDETEVEDAVLFDQRDDKEILERNVKEATANATGEPTPAATGEKITKDNYKDVLCHIGKAEGNILGKRVGEIPRKILEWLRDNWSTKLPPVPSAKDVALRDAVVLALAETQELADAAEEMKKDSESAIASRLVERAKDLLLTAEQFQAYLIKFGFMGDDETILALNRARLTYLDSAEGWAKFTELLENEVKPKDKSKRKRTTTKQAKKHEPPQKKFSGDLFGGKTDERSPFN